MNLILDKINTERCGWHLKDTIGLQAFMCCALAFKCQPLSTYHSPM